MAIYSACSDLRTREIRWAMRENNDEAINGTQYPLSAWVISGKNAEVFASDVQGVTID